MKWHVTLYIFNPIYSIKYKLYKEATNHYAFMIINYFKSSISINKRIKSILDFNKGGGSKKLLYEYP